MQVVMVLSVVLTIAALGMLFKLAERIEEENRMLESGLETLRIYNESLQKKITDIRRFRHDAAGLLQAIDMYGIDNANVVLGREASAQHNVHNARKAMPLLEAIVELKRRQCAEESIDFKCPDRFPDMPEGMMLPDETDLCLLMQNLLDNAYEANLRIDEKSRRMMSLDVRGIAAGSDTGRNAASTLVITVTNRVDSQEKISFLTRKSKPELHGIGLRIVDDILKKYNGRRAVSTDPADSIISTTAELQILHI